MTGVASAGVTTTVDSRASTILRAWASVSLPANEDRGAEIYIGANRAGDAHHGQGTLFVEGWKVIHVSADERIIASESAISGPYPSSCPGLFHYSFDPATYRWRVRDTIPSCVVFETDRRDGNGNWAQTSTRHARGTVRINLDWHTYGRTRVENSLGIFLLGFLIPIPEGSIGRQRDARVVGTLSFRGIHRTVTVDHRRGWVEVGEDLG